jgi:nucleotide-binding universal stress UspA family protein
MIRIDNILVPVDFSPPSQKAVNYGLALALEFRARLTLAHVVPSVTKFGYSFPNDANQMEKRMFAEARVRMPEMISDEYRTSLELETIVRTGDVREELVTLVNDEDIDLVVMGTHGRGSFEHFLLGSTTEKVIRTIPVPILTVSHISPEKEVHLPEHVKIRRIVYATDLSFNGEVGLRYAADVARTFKAELTVLHVMDDFELGANLGPYAPDSSVLRVNDLKRLRHFIEAEHATDLHPKAVTLDGTPYRAITSFAKEQNADLIVINLQSKGFLERAMLGATAERVIRSATVPVLSLPMGRPASPRMSVPVIESASL